MNWTPSVWLLVALLLVPVSEAWSQSRSETLLVAVELGPNSTDIHGVGMPALRSDAAGHSVACHLHG